MVLEYQVFIQTVLLEEVKVFFGDGFCIHDVALATLDGLHVFLKMSYLLDYAMSCIDGGLCHLAMLVVLIDLVCKTHIDAILRVYHVRVVIQLDDMLHPLAINTLVILLADLVRDFPDLSVEVSLDSVRHGVHTEFVPLAVITPVIGIDGEFTCTFDVKFSVTESEEYSALVSSVVLGNLFLTDKCCNFHCSK